MKEDGTISYKEFLTYAKKQLWTRKDMHSSKLFARVRANDKDKASKFIEIQIVKNEFKTKLPELLKLGLDETAFDKPIVDKLLNEAQKSQPNLFVEPDASMLYSVLLLINSDVAVKFKENYESKKSNVYLLNILAVESGKVCPSIIKDVKLLKDKKTKLSEAYDKMVKYKIDTIKLIVESILSIKKIAPDVADQQEKELTQVVAQTLVAPKKYNKERLQLLADFRGSNQAEDFLDEKELTKEQLIELNKTLAPIKKIIVNDKVVGL